MNFYRNIFSKLTSKIEKGPLKQRQKENIAFYNTIPPMGKWHLIQNQPYLKEIFQEPPILSYQVMSLKDTLVRAKL